MARYRSIHTKFWTDGEVENLKPQAKLLMLYLLTNPYRNESGLYSLTIKRMSDDTGLNLKEISRSLKELEQNEKVVYDPQAQAVWVVNAIRYQAMNVNCRKSVVKDLETAASKSLRSKLLTYYKSLSYDWLPNPSEPMANHSEPMANPSIGVGIGLDIDKGGVGGEDRGGEKKVYGEHRNVCLTDEEHEKLIKKLGPERLAKGINILSGYKESKGKTYKSDYATFSTWVIQRLQELEGGKNGRAHGPPPPRDDRPPPKERCDLCGFTGSPKENLMHRCTRKLVRTESG